MSIRDKLEEQTKIFRSWGHPVPLDHFLLKFGQRHEPRDGDRGCRKMAAKMCFKNATSLAMQGLGTYCEGYVTWQGCPINIHHAWVLGKDGRVLEPTLKRPKDYEYFGVPITEEEHLVEMLKHKVYGILDPGHGVNVVFMEAYAMARGVDWDWRVRPEELEKKDGKVAAGG